MIPGILSLWPQFAFIFLIHSVLFVFGFYVICLPCYFNSDEFPKDDSVVPVLLRQEVFFVDFYILIKSKNFHLNFKQGNLYFQFVI